MIFKELINRLRGFKWFLMHGTQIRTKGKDGYEMCPIIACAYKKEGTREGNNTQWADASKRLGMDHEDGHVVIAAADQPLVELQESLDYYERRIKACDPSHKDFMTKQIRHYRRAIHLRRRLERELF